MLFETLFTSSLLASLATAAKQTFDWNITWVTANPDGQHERPVIGINNAWPLPRLNITRGDRVVVNMHNQVREVYLPETLSLTKSLAGQPKHESALPRTLPKWHKRDGRPSGSNAV